MDLQRKPTIDRLRDDLNKGHGTMTRKLMLILALLALSLGACSSTPTAEEATENLCSSVASLRTSMQDLAALGPNSTVDEAEAARAAVQDAWDEVQADARVVNEAAANEAQDALDQFNDAIGGISGESSLADAATGVLNAAQALSTALDEIENSITCD